MSGVSIELIVKELNARLESLENHQKAMDVIVNTLVSTMSPQQTDALKAMLKEKFAFAINHGLPELRESFEIQKIAVEHVVGSLD